MPPAQQSQRASIPSTSSSSLIRPEERPAAAAAHQPRLHGKQSRTDSDAQGAVAAASPSRKRLLLPAAAAAKQPTAASMASGPVEPQPRSKAAAGASGRGKQKVPPLTEKQKREGRKQRGIDLRGLTAKNGWAGVTSYSKLNRSPKTTKVRGE